MRIEAPSPRQGIVLLCVLALVACGAPEPEQATSLAEEERAAVAVTVLRLSPREVVDAAEMPADLRPRRRATLATEVAGTVEARQIEAGDRVRAGQVLLEIDTRALRQRLAEAEAVDRQRRTQFERAQALLERRSITQAQFLDALTAKDVALAQLESARLELEKSRLVAPWSGQVAAVHCEVGDYAVAGKAAVELVDTSRIDVVATAPAAEVPFLQVGKETEVRVDIYPGDVFTGAVTRLGAELDAASRTLEVVVELGNASGRLRPGLSARVRVPRRRIEAALLVPLAAVVELGERRVVYVVEDGRARQRTIELGPVIAGEAVVEAGLSAGDAVIVEGQRRLSPGQRVDPAVAAASDAPQQAGEAAATTTGEG